MRAKPQTLPSAGVFARGRGRSGRRRDRGRSRGSRRARVRAHAAPLARATARCHVARMSRPLSLDLSTDAVRPYFLWSEDATVADLRDRLASATGVAWAQLAGMIMREARDPDVWRFVTPQAVADRY